MENLLLSPHCADETASYVQDTWDTFCERLREFQAADFHGFRDQAGQAKHGASTSGGQVAGLLSGGKGIRGARSGAEALPAELEPMEARERALRRVARAAHHFAALGLTAAEAMTATPAVVQKAWGGMVAM